MAALRFYWLILAILCVWRLTHLLQAEDGPGDIFVHLRQRAGSGFWGKLLDCFFCLSLWMALPVALLAGQDWKERAFLWLAASAGAILLETARQRTDSLSSAQYYEEGGEHGLLQPGTDTTAGVESTTRHA